MEDCSAEITTAVIIPVGKQPHWYHARLNTLDTFIKASLNPYFTAAQVLIFNNVNKDGPPEPDYTVTQVLSGLESSLRTESHGWVCRFLRNKKRGFYVFLRFFTLRLIASSKMKPQELQQLGPLGEGVHLCLLCLKAIMERHFGFCQVVTASESSSEGQLPSSPALNVIALSIAHQNVGLQAKAFALDLLATVCLMDGGAHRQLVLIAFDHVQREMPAEERRFQSLVHLFTTFAPFDRRLNVACMQFINIMVNVKPQDLSLRISLQVEFRMLGLDEAYLRERLQHSCSSAELQLHIQAYLDNIIDVGTFLGEHVFAIDSEQ